MKYFNLLSIIILTLIIVSCGGGKKDEESFFSFDNSILKEQYLTTESLNIALKNVENKKIDSIIYYFNDKKIETKTGFEKISVNLSNEKCGEKKLKALIYFEGENQEINSLIEIVSNIEPKLISYKIINIYPHDSLSFTEGLEFYRDTLFESTGLNGFSRLLKTDYKTGKILKSLKLDDQYFGEGITILKNKIYQLTWQNNVGFVYDADTWKLEKTFKYDHKMEGWGMTNDGINIYHNDSSERIWKLDPEKLKVIDKINVYTGKSKVIKINELEWIDGKIYSNIWQKDGIAIINPDNGKVEGYLDMRDLRKSVKNKEAEVLNGIAYNPKTKTVFITGKNWDKMFEIKILN